MSSALGTLTIKDSAYIASSGMKALRCTLTGDAAYPTGGTAGLLGAVRSALGDDGAMILAVVDLGGGDWRNEYTQPVFHDSAGNVTTDPRALANGGSIASGDTLLNRVASTGSEASNGGDMHTDTFNLLIWVK